ncbi:MAG TPA: penicillin-binding transpeptidase domain-containing protein [Verrucomicrobiae bacterium]
MLILDQLKRNDPPLRVLSLVVAAGLLILLAGLWWVQIVSSHNYQARLETQSFRTVRVPAVRGRILDRNGVALAENRPRFNVGLYLEDLRRAFDAAGDEAIRRERTNLNLMAKQRERDLGRSLTPEEQRPFKLSLAAREALRRSARALVASNMVTEISRQLLSPQPFNEANFARHYATRLALPYPVLVNLNPTQVACFAEQSLGRLGADLDIQSLRVYPLGTTAAHVVGYLTRDDDRSYEGELATFSYRLPDYRGVVGIESGFDAQLRGRAGAKSVLVNNLGYKQAEDVWSAAQPGQNVVLTLDTRLQQAAEHALRQPGARTRGAAVVMDVWTGDILAMASAPSPNPNFFVQGFTPGEYDKLFDENLRPLINRATQENYAPGSIFKPIVGLACLEAGLNPKAVIYNPPNPAEPGKGHIVIGRRTIRDTAPPGHYDFRRAIVLSSNTYFISNGLKAGITRIVQLGQKLHLGERVNLPTRQETAGIFPTLDQVQAGWFDGDTANICFGQGHIAVSPLQMAVMTAALANGGLVLWPRLVDRIETPEDTPGGVPVLFPQAQVRGRLGVRPENLRILHEAMLAETEDAEGTGKAAVVPGLRICGKTGTAQVSDERNRIVGHNTWFIAFAPFERPRYAVVVMVEDGVSGGRTCAPIAREIFTALLKREAGELKLVARAD